MIREFGVATVGISKPMIRSVLNEELLILIFRLFYLLREGYLGKHHAVKSVIMEILGLLMIFQTGVFTYWAK